MENKLIVWVLCLALVCSLARAATEINDTKISGERGIGGWLKAYDSFNGEAVVKVDGDMEITPGQVKFGLASAQSCYALRGGYKCSVSLGSETYVPSEVTVPIHLFDDLGNEVMSQDYALGIDGYGPTVNLLLKSGFTNGKNPVQVNYSIVDTAFPGSEDCSGIGGITFTVPGGSDQTLDISTSDCEAEGSTLITIPPGTEDIEVCALAFDLLMQNGPFACQTIKVDTVAPTVVEDSLRFDIQGLPEGNTFLGPGKSYLADVYVKLNDPNTDKVTADFSGVNSEHQNYLMDANQCTLADTGVFECVFNNVEVVLGTEATSSVILKVSDLAGNNATLTLNYQFGLDNSGPEPLSMIVNNKQDDPLWVGPSITSIFVKFKEYGAGLSPDKVFLDLSVLGGSEKAPAKSCTKASDEEWGCSWGELSSACGLPSATISVSSDTTDALGNAMTGSLSKVLHIDCNAPSIISFNMTQPDAPFQLRNYTFLEGYPIIVNAKLQEANELLTTRVDPAWVRAAGLLNDTDLVGTTEVSDNITAQITEGCNRLSDGFWNCTYTIEKPFPGVYGATFVFEDIGMGSAEKTVEMTVYDVRNTTTKYWKVGSMERMPSAVDRSTAPYLNHQLMFLVGLGLINPGMTPPTTTTLTSTPTTVASTTPTTTGGCTGASCLTGSATAQLDAVRSKGIEASAPATYVKLLKVVDANCTGKDWEDYVLTDELFDGSDLGERPFYQILLKQMVMPLRNLNITCHLELYSLITSGDEKWVNDNPEQKNVTLEIPFYDTELPAEVLKKKIDSAVNDNLFVNIVKSPLYQTLETVYGIAQTLTEADRVLLQVADAMTAVEGLCDVLGAGTCSTFMDPFIKDLNAIHSAVAPYLTWLSCNQSIWEEIFPDSPFVENVLKEPEKFASSNIGSKWMKDNGYTQDDLTNPKKSLIASVAMLCLPGIMDNLKQFSNIQCGYAYCLQEASKMGIPSLYCEDLKSYENCVAMAEEFMYFFPIKKVYDDFAQAGNMALKSPISLIATGGAIACEFIPGIDVVCNFVKIGKALNSVDLVLNVVNNWGSWSTPVDYCSLLETTTTAETTTIADTSGVGNEAS